MTEVIKIQSPSDGNGKDPNDTRDDPGYREKLEEGLDKKLGIYIASSKAGKTIPQREWIWNSWASAGVVTGLSGAPGAAKSLFAQQLCTHAAVGVQFLGDKMLKAPAMHISCEDDEDELDRRQATICEAMGIPLPEDLHLASWVGEEALLVVLQDGRFVRTNRFKLLDEYMGDYGIRMATLDLIPDFWNGNEIIRTQVNAFVKSHLAYLAQRHKAALFPLFHPSQAGISNGTGQSGSTAWEGSFRGRIYIERKDEKDPTNNDRIVKRAKANYAALDEKEITWREGYLLEKGVDKVEEQASRNVGTFMEILQHCESRDIEVSPSPQSSNYYGKRFLEIWELMDGRRSKITQRAMEKAFTKVRYDGAVEVTERRSNKRPRIKYVGYNSR